jgi:formylglycine-generating enzyme required for sulfatase activity
MSAGEGPFSLLHACGNAREWCIDRYDPRWYEQCSRVDPRWPTRTHHRVVRGGSYSSPQQSLVLQCRDHLPPGSQEPDVGFRVVVAWRPERP